MAVPNEGEVVLAQEYLTDEDLTLKLYSNNVTPGESDTAATFTEVAGGGYVAKTLDKDEWTIVGGNPTNATQASKDFSFTGITTAPSTLYGYYIVDALNKIRGAERFPEAVVPFEPVNGSLIRINPKMQVS